MEDHCGPGALDACVAPRRDHGECVRRPPGVAGPSGAGVAGVAAAGVVGVGQAQGDASCSLVTL